MNRDPNYNSRSSMPNSKQPGKNAYEIRSDVLALASSTVWSQYYARVEQSKIPPKDQAPTEPTTADVIECAEEFYQFVSGN